MYGPGTTTDGETPSPQTWERDASRGQQGATLASCDLVDPSIRRRLDNRAVLGVTLILAGAVGATTATGLWVSINNLRGQAEEAGRWTAVTAATAFGTLAEPSAANIARTLGIVLDEQLRAQAAATGMLIEAAESARHGAACIEDALRQIAVGSPIRRIHVTAEDGPSYTTEQSALRAGCSPSSPRCQRQSRGRCSRVKGGATQKTSRTK
ncbi:MAG: hypothetical protein OXG04_28795 [Acidobacteria bacterium]|nr:hypothetical protein [Acidobacteriota bacterium]